MMEQVERDFAAEEQARGEVLDSRGFKRNKFWSVNNDPSETLQSQAAMGDISEILKQYKQVGIVENLNTAEAMFLDVTEFDDFTDVMRAASLAEEEFMKLPSKVREIFGHDVHEWLDVAHDPEKRAEYVKAGKINGPDGPKVEAKAEPKGEAKTDEPVGKVVEVVAKGKEPPDGGD